MRIVAISRSVALAMAVTLAAGCGAEPDTGEVGGAPGADAPPATLPPPVAGPGTDGTPGPLPVPGPEPDPDGDATVPSRFQGRYAADQAACDAPGNPTQLDIDSDTISFHESAGPITEVASGPSDITLTAGLTGEGDAREATYRFRLSDDGDTLSDLGGGMERVRCAD